MCIRVWIKYAIEATYRYTRCNGRCRSGSWMAGRSVVGGGCRRRGTCRSLRTESSEEPRPSLCYVKLRCYLSSYNERRKRGLLTRQAILRTCICRSKYSRRLSPARFAVCRMVFALAELPAERPPTVPPGRSPQSPSPRSPIWKAMSTAQIGELE